MSPSTYSVFNRSCPTAARPRIKKEKKRRSARKKNKTKHGRADETAKKKKGRRTDVAVNVAPVDGVGAHVGVEVPEADGVVAGTRDERAGGQDGLEAFFQRRVGLDAPDAGRVVQERVRFAHLRSRSNLGINK